MLYDFKVKTAIRATVLLILMAGVAYALATQQWAMAILLFIPLVGFTWNLFYFIDQTNRDLAAFLKSIQYNDFTTTTSGGHKGKAFRTLHDSFNMINRKFQDVRAEKEANHQFLQSIVEHIDIGLLAYNQEGEIILMNKALQRLLHKSYLINFAALKQVDEQLWQITQKLKAGERELVKLNIDGKLQQIAIQCAELKLQDDHYRLISFQNIQSELEQQELVAFQKLIRILTHEIMNSVAPISSLSSTLSGMMDSGSEIDKEQIKRSLQVINKRSEGLLDFTETYRKLTRIPPPRFQAVDGNALLKEIATLFQPEMEKQGITLELRLPPQDVVFQADPALLEQVIINLVRNAADALAGQDDPRIILSVKKLGNKSAIIVADNGCGISQETMEEIFVPFFTTKEHGSGIGLSLSRQIIRLHKGMLELSSKPGEGTVATIHI